MLKKSIYNFLKNKYLNRWNRAKYLALLYPCSKTDFSLKNNIFKITYTSNPSNHSFVMSSHIKRKICSFVMIMVWICNMLRLVFGIYISHFILCPDIYDESCNTSVEIWFPCKHLVYSIMLFLGWLMLN